MLTSQHKYFCWVATVLTVYGIETYQKDHISTFVMRVATVLTVYGIETNADNSLQDT